MKYLKFNNHKLDSENVEEIFAIIHNSMPYGAKFNLSFLTTLDFGANPIGDSGLAIIARNLHLFPALSELSLYQIGATDKGVEILANSMFEKMMDHHLRKGVPRALKIFDNHISPKGQADLANVKIIASLVIGSLPFSLVEGAQGELFLLKVDLHNYSLHKRFEGEHVKFACQLSHYSEWLDLLENKAMTSMHNLFDRDNQLHDRYYAETVEMLQFCFLSYPGIREMIQEFIDGKRMIEASDLRNINWQALFENFQKDKSSVADYDVFGDKDLMQRLVRGPVMEGIKFAPYRDKVKESEDVAYLADAKDEMDFIDISRIAQEEESLSFDLPIATTIEEVEVLFKNIISQQLLPSKSEQEETEPKDKEKSEELAKQAQQIDPNIIQLELVKIALQEATDGMIASAPKIFEFITNNAFNKLQQIIESVDSNQVPVNIWFAIIVQILNEPIKEKVTTPDIASLEQAVLESSIEIINKVQALYNQKLGFWIEDRMEMQIETWLESVQKTITEQVIKASYGNRQLEEEGFVEAVEAMKQRMLLAMEEKFSVELFNLREARYAIANDVTDKQQDAKQQDAKIQGITDKITALWHLMEEQQKNIEAQFASTQKQIQADVQAVIEYVQENFVNFDDDYGKHLQEQYHDSTMFHKEMATIAFDQAKMRIYKQVQQELNATYIAAAAVGSEYVDVAADKAGLIGKIGAFLQSIGPSVPVIGLGVAVLGGIMQGWDRAKINEGLQNLQSIAINAERFGVVAEYIARQVALNLNTALLFAKDSLDDGKDLAATMCDMGVILAEQNEFSAKDFMFDSGVIRSIGGYLSKLMPKATKEQDKLSIVDQKTEKIIANISSFFCKKVLDSIFTAEVLLRGDEIKDIDIAKAVYKQTIAKFFAQEQQQDDGNSELVLEKRANFYDMFKISKQQVKEIEEKAGAEYWEKIEKAALHGNWNYSIDLEPGEIFLEKMVKEGAISDVFGVDTSKEINYIREVIFLHIVKGISNNILRLDCLVGFINKINDLFEDRIKEAAREPLAPSDFKLLVDKFLLGDFVAEPTDDFTEKELIGDEQKEYY